MFLAFQEIESFFPNFLRIIDKKWYLQVTSEKIYFFANSPVIREPKFGPKSLCFFAFKNTDVLTKIQNQLKNMIDSGIPTRYLWAAQPWCRRTYVLYKLPTILLCLTKSARRAQNQEKRKKILTTQLINFL